MAERGVALAILGIVAVIAVVGLIMLFTGAAGQGVYGGQLRQDWDDPNRQPGEAPLRYVSPVPGAFGEQPPGNPDVPLYYTGGKSTDRNWWDWSRNPCPDRFTPVFQNELPAYQGIARIGARSDCFPSEVREDLFCCRLGGQAGAGVGVYE